MIELIEKYKYSIISGIVSDDNRLDFKNLINRIIHGKKTIPILRYRLLNIVIQNNLSTIDT